jgi:hypothetical protein
MMYLLSNGRLFAESGSRVFPRAPRFVTTAEAETWLKYQDELGTVRLLSECTYGLVTVGSGART